MANRHPLHTRTKSKGALVSTPFGAQGKKLPILPYERQLIEALGCTEEEYRHYRRGLINNTKRRPAAYAHIPEVEAGPGVVTSIIVSLVVGAVLTGISMLLAPKPRENDQTEVTNKKLADQNGATRFNSSTGFDGMQQIGKLGAPIPIIFGKYQTFDDMSPTGGISTAPLLLWSRMFSYGSHQGYKGLYMIGETLGGETTNRPEPVGVQLGTTPLDALPDRQQAVYWSVGGRMTPSNLIWGTRGYPASGDPENQEDVFSCPIFDDPHGPGFCQAINPPTTSQFGVFGSIKNGTAYRVNWRVISIPNIEGIKDDPDDRLKNERRKIAGRDADGDKEDKDNGMPGVGRGYGIYMGINGLNSWYPNEPEADIPVNVGDTINFVIRGSETSKDEARFDSKSGVTADDINQALNSLRANADDLLQVGEIYMIGRCLFQVENRAGGQDQVWRAGGPDVNVTLRMIETTTGPNSTRIGIAGALATERAIVREGTQFEGQGEGYIGPSFWPLSKVALGLVRNVRPTECTEFGIKSNVWQQGAGLCNFNTVPPPNQLIRYDDDAVQIQNGSMNRYFARTSVFTIWLRPVGLMPHGEPYQWAALGEQFCVTGSQPVDQYNYIRIKSTLGKPLQLEYRFIPKTNADVKFQAEPNAQYWRLNARTGNVLARSISTAYGTFIVSTVGDVVTQDDIDDNPEMYSEGKKESFYTECGPQSGVILGWLPDYKSKGRSAAFCYELFGDPETQREVTKNGKFTYQDGAGRAVRMVLRAKSVRFHGNYESYEAIFGTPYRWSIEHEGHVGDYEGEWTNGERFDYLRTPSAGNYFARIAGLSRIGARYEVSVGCTQIWDAGNVARVFESRSQLAEISHYDELRKSCETGPEHTITYINESVTNISGTPDYLMTTMGLAVRSGTALANVQQLRTWIPNGVTCVNFRTQNAIDPPAGPSNLFCDLIYWLLTNDRGGIGELTYSSHRDNQWIRTDTFHKTALFLDTNRIFYDGVIQDQVNLRSYLTQLAPLMLCNFVIAGGQFSVTPALPTDTEGNIAPNQVPISALFTDGNIVDGSYTLDYLEASERQDFRAVMSWRVCEKNKVPMTETLLMRWLGDEYNRAPQEVYDLTAFCTSVEQARLTARYLLSIRRRVDHVISFETSPVGLNLAPGDFIKVMTQTAPSTNALNAVISVKTGAILAMDPIPDGTYQVKAYRVGHDDIEELSITVTNNRVADQSLWGMIFSTSTPEVEDHTYLVEQLNISQEAVCQITASHFPMENGRSVIADDCISPNRFYDTTVNFGAEA